MRLPAGTSTERVMVEAMKLYKQRTDQNFVHHQCWSILRHSREWADHLAKPRMLLPLKRKRLSADPLHQSPPSSSSDDDGNEQPPLKTTNPTSLLPPANPPQLLNDQRLALIADLVQAIKRKNDLLEDFNRLERETNHIKIMSQFNSDESELWFKLKQQEILNEFNLNILS